AGANCAAGPFQSTNAAGALSCRQTNHACNWGSSVAIGDVDGSGIPQLLVWGPWNAQHLAVLRFAPNGTAASSSGTIPDDDAPRPGLLQTINTMGGLTTTIRYQSVANLNRTLEPPG